MQSKPQEVLTLQSFCHGIVMLMGESVEAFCVQQQRVLAKPPQLPKDLARQGYTQSLQNFHIFVSLLHSCIEPGFTEMLDSPTQRIRKARLLHLWTCSPERQRQIAKAGVSAVTQFQHPRQLPSLRARVMHVTDLKF